MSRVFSPNVESLAQDIAVALQHTVFTLKDGLQMGWGGRLATDQRRVPVVGMPIDAQCLYPDTDAHNFDTLSANLAISSMFVLSDSTCGSNVASVPSNYDEH